MGVVGQGANPISRVSFYRLYVAVFPLEGWEAGRSGALGVAATASRTTEVGFFIWPCLDYLYCDAEVSGDWRAQLVLDFGEDERLQWVGVMLATRHIGLRC